MYWCPVVRSKTNPSPKKINCTCGRAIRAIATALLMFSNLTFLRVHRGLSEISLKFPPVQAFHLKGNKCSRSGNIMHIDYLLWQYIVWWSFNVNSTRTYERQWYCQGLTVWRLQHVDDCKPVDIRRWCGDTVGNWPTEKPQLEHEKNLINFMPDAVPLCARYYSCSRVD